jgi:hypothetical protein
LRGAFAYPEDQTRLQGGLCANTLIVKASEWDRLTDGPAEPRTLPTANRQWLWDEAKSICKACPILARCEAQTLNEKLGVWGGRDQLERHNLRKAAMRRAAKERATAALVEPETAAQPVPEPATASVMPKREFPPEDPAGYDGWVRIRQVMRSVFYMAQTPDGTYTKVKLKGDKAPMIKWCPTGDVDLRRSVTVEIQEWAGRPERKMHGVPTPVADAA